MDVSSCPGFSASTIRKRLKMIESRRGQGSGNTNAPKRASKSKDIYARERERAEFKSQRGYDNAISVQLAEAALDEASAELHRRVEAEAAAFEAVHAARRANLERQLQEVGVPVTSPPPMSNVPV